MKKMRTAETIRYQTLSPLSAARQAICLDDSQEGFVFCADGEIRMILPGETYLPVPGSDQGFGTVRNSASVRCVAGAGNIPLDQTRSLGGRVSFSCRILSPRRFIICCTDDLVREKSAEDILSEYMGDYFTRVLTRAGESFSGGTPRMLRRVIWKEIRQDTEDELLNIGWQLTDLKLESLQVV